MNEKVRRRLTKNQIFTVPNFLSLFRILLIPLFVVTFVVYEDRIWTVVIIGVSALTDVVDGRIARKFSMVSDLGKFLDPVADKLTQAAMIACFIATWKSVSILFCFFAVKEIFQFISGLFVFRKADRLDGSKWYGKLSTVFLYAAMMYLFLWPESPAPVVFALFTACGAFLLLSMVLYTRFYFHILKEAKLKETSAESPIETNESAETETLAEVAVSGEEEKK